MKYTLIITFLIFQNCQGQSNNSNFINQEDMDSELLNKYAISNGYKPLAEKEFAEKCLDLFGINIGNNKENSIKLNDSDYTINIPNKNIKTFPESLFYNPSIEGQVTKEQAEATLNNKENGIGQKFLSYNKLLFNDDKFASFYFLKNKFELKEVVLYFDYETNNTLTYKLITDIDYDDLDKYDLTHFLFYNDKSKGIKKYMLNEVFNKVGVEKFYSLSLDFINYFNKIEINDDLKRNGSGFLLSKLVSFDLSQNYNSIEDEYGYQFYIQMLAQDPEFKLYLISNDYLNNQRIKKIVNSYNLIKEEDQIDIDAIEAIIQDTDGFVNLRKEQNNNSEIIGKIKSGEKIITFPSIKNDMWWVKTKDGKVGFVHKTRIKLIN